MEKREHEAIVYMLRKATKIVKVYPFVYAAMYLMCMAVFYFADETTSAICDTLFAITPIMVVPFIRLSYILKLCVWHRFQCVLPIFPMIVSVISFFVDFSLTIALVSISTAVLIFLLSILNAYFMFIRK